jgi:hypothetical protein
MDRETLDSLNFLAPQFFEAARKRAPLDLALSTA